MNARVLAVCVLASLLLAPLSYADGLLPKKQAESPNTVMEVKMPDGSIQKGFIRDGVFIPILNATTEPTVQPEAPKATTQTAQSEAIILPAGTPVQVTIDKMIDADEVKVGEVIPAHISAPIKHNGKVIFPMGTPIKGTVVRKRNNSIAGIPGSIELGGFKIITPDGGVLPLTGNLQRKGNNRVAGSLIGAYFVLLPIFVKGQDGKIESGAESTMYTAQEWSAQ